MKMIKIILLTFVAIIMFSNHLFPIIYGSVSGVVTEEETGKVISNVDIYIYGRTNRHSETDKEGKFAIKLLKPGKYMLAISPPFPYCSHSRGEFEIKPGENVVFNGYVMLAGTIRGKVLYKDSKKPFPGVSIKAWGLNAGMALETSNEDGSYFLGIDNGRLCPSSNYYIEAKCNIPNIAYKVLLDVIVEKNKESIVEDIFFDLNDSTGIEGFITSSLDKKPLNNIQISIFHQDTKYPGTNNDIILGEIYTNSDGYYYIENLEPGTYWIYILPPIQNDWNDYEYSLFCKEKRDILVYRGEKSLVSSQLKISSSIVSAKGDENE